MFEKEVALPQEEVNPFILLHRCRAAKKMCIRDRPQGVQAQYVPKQRTIYVRNGMDEMATLCAIAREQAHASFDAVGTGYYRQAYAAQSYCAAYVVAQKFGLDTSGFKFDKVCQSCAGKDAQELRAFLSDVKRAAYSINREVQCGFREMEQAIQPLSLIHICYEAVGIEITDAYYKLGSDRVRFALGARESEAEPVE